MLPRLFSLPLAHASLHGQLLRPAAACNLLVIAKPHRIAINDPLAHCFVQAGYAVLATELLTEREAAYAEAAQDTARLTSRLLQLLALIQEDADTRDLNLILLASDDVSPAAVRAAARRDTQVAAVVACGGLVDRFVKARAARMLDMSDTPWRWKPEARFEGLTPESAVFLQRATEIGSGLFPNGQAGATLTLSALAERGRAFVTLGGAGGPVEAATESLVLAWPGTRPEAGIEVVFTAGEGEARLAQPGFWGLLRLLAPLRLRDRDKGTRFLVDLKAGSSRLFLEIVVDRPQNPIALRKLIEGFSCPPVL